jgi:hypothetical protein
LYGCDTWSLTLRQEDKLRIIENMALRRSFGRRGDEENGRMELHNKKIHEQIRIIKSRRMRWVGHIARMR